MISLYSKPSVELLKKYKRDNAFSDREYVKHLGEELRDFFKIYKVKVTVADFKVTPFSVRFDLIPQLGVSVKKIRDLREEMELAFAAPIEIDVATDKVHTIYVTMRTWEHPLVGFRDILESKEFKNNDFLLPVAAGMDVLGTPFCFDLASTPNLFVAGFTGAGKSMFLNVIILSIMFNCTPEEVAFVMIDPKIVELGQYNGNPFLLSPVVFDLEKAMDTLRKISVEINNRFILLAQRKCRDISAYNELVGDHDKLRRIVLVIDEYADLVAEKNKELEDIIGLIARNGRATGIHLVLSTQRPNNKVISNSIKSSIPCRASFALVDWRESKAILDRTGAERLRGSGDMLFSVSKSSAPLHVQAAYIPEDELDKCIEYIRNSNVRYRR